MNNAKGPYEAYTDYQFMHYCYKNGMIEVYDDLMAKRRLDRNTYKIYKKIIGR